MSQVKRSRRQRRKVGRMMFLESIAIMGTAGIVLVVIGYIVLMTWRRGWSDSRPVLLGELLRSQGEGVARLAIAPGGHGFALAVRRCLDCEAKVQCRAWLDSGKREGYEAFCPNAGFVARMKSLAGATGRAPWKA